MLYYSTKTRFTMSLTGNVKSVFYDVSVESVLSYTKKQALIVRLQVFDLQSPVVKDGISSPVTNHVTILLPSYLGWWISNSNALHEHSPCFAHSMIDMNGILDSGRNYNTQLFIKPLSFLHLLVLLPNMDTLTVLSSTPPLFTAIQRYVPLSATFRSLTRRVPLSWS